ncbi:baseplate assembly protein [Vallitalea guaymasensis]|uniref:baseplate assembly protein n=1 Tax=Vallitalea guaymasensis TaxID=1185412 RepID=UPI000DE340C5|nr:baseplate J/gp47 family protein [Vallitalea guaymasensis]
MENNKDYPNISFVDTDTEILVNSLIKSYEMFTGRILYPADPIRLFILWVADIIIQERVIIDNSAKQNIPRYAKGEYLDSIGEIFKDIYRLDEKAAKTTLRFHLSTTIESQQLVPMGTRVTVDGGITFATIEDLYIKVGDLTGDVLAECQTAGEIGNDFIPGQITKLVDLFPYYEKVENITTSAGGAGKETDEAFYGRMRESMESFSTAGPEGAYKYHVETVSSEVADVSVTSPTKGEIDIRVLLTDGVLPSEEVLNDIRSVIAADDIRPLGDNVTVLAPDTITFSIELTYYIPKMSANSGTIIAEEVTKAVNEYKAWQTEKMGRDINPSYLIALLMKTGIKRVAVTSPIHAVIEENKVAQLQSSNVINGGVEDE